MVGGIAGNNYGTIENCFVNGHVESDHYHSSKDADLGGIVGLNESGGTVKYCFMSGDVKNTDGNSGVGGIAGSNEGTIEHVTFFGSVSVDHSQDNKWVGDQDNTLNNNYDSFNQSEYNSASGNDMYRRGLKYGSLSNPFVISSDADWRAFLDYINYCCNFSDKTVRLDCNVSTSSTVSNSEINAFRGTFDGNGHTININIKDTGIEGLALFRFINGATIKNLNLTGSITGGKYVAALVGIVNGTGNRIEGCAAVVTVNGQNNIGGLVGHARSSGLVIDGCVFNGPMNMIGSKTWPYSSGIFIGECDNGSNMSVSNSLLIMQGGYWGFRLAPYGVSRTNVLTDGEEVAEAIPARIGAQLKDYGVVKVYEHGISYNDHYYVDKNLALSGLGTEANPTRIGKTADWNAFADCVNGGFNFSGMFVKLTANISVSTMVGTDDSHSFQGTFDGDGHTMTLNISERSRAIAPFRYVSGATIKNLKTTGSVTGNYTSGSDAMDLSGIVSWVCGTTTIEDCVSSVAISSDRPADVDAGGIVAHVHDNQTVNVRGCAFTGSITYSNANGYEGAGLVGWLWTDATANITNCLFAPSAMSISNWNSYYTFVCGTNANITNCYYVPTDNLPTNQGTSSFVVATAPWSIGRSIQDYGMVKAYEHGIFYDGTYCVHSILLYDWKNSFWYGKNRSLTANLAGLNHKNSNL